MDMVEVRDLETMAWLWAGGLMCGERSGWKRRSVEDTGLEVWKDGEEG